MTILFADIVGFTELAGRIGPDGAPGEDTVSSRTYELVREEFAGIEREPVHIKGKGLMTTWFLQALPVADGT